MLPAFDSSFSLRVWFLTMRCRSVQTSPFSRAWMRARVCRLSCRRSWPTVRLPLAPTQRREWGPSCAAVNIAPAAGACAVLRSNRDPDTQSHGGDLVLELEHGAMGWVWLFAMSSRRRSLSVCWSESRRCSRPVRRGSSCRLRSRASTWARMRCYRPEGGADELSFASLSASGTMPPCGTPDPFVFNNSCELELLYSCRFFVYACVFACLCELRVDRPRISRSLVRLLV